MIDIQKSSIRLRSAAEVDVPLLNSWWNDGAVMAHAGFPEGLRQGMEQTLSQVKRSREAGGWLCIIEIEGKAVGECSLKVWKNEGHPGWKICDLSYQNRGFGPMIIQMTMDYYFSGFSLNSDKPLARVVWDTMLDNIRAQRVYERLPGVRRLGVRENCWQDQTGRWHSAVDYELTREDWTKWAMA